MNITADGTADGSTIAIVPRGILSAPVVQVEDDLEANYQKRIATRNYLRGKIDAGDYIGKAALAGQSTQEPRALIIAASYSEYKGKIFPAMTATAKDAELIHRMLVDVFGYDEKNIRILCDAYEAKKRPETRPTRDNIRKSLEWLTSDIPDNVHTRRYLHFSGHGVIQPAKNEKEGKLIRRPGKDMLGRDKWDPRVAPRPDDKERDPTQINAKTISKIELSFRDLGFYNEAIATGNLDDNKSLENNLIYDKAGIIAMTELPEVSPIQTKGTERVFIKATIKMCHDLHTRHLSTKVDGAGFRAGNVGSEADEIEALYQSDKALIKADDSRPASDPVAVKADLEHLVVDDAGSKQNNEGTISEEEYRQLSPANRIWSKFLGIFGLGISQVTLHEDLVDEEKKMDQTKPGVVRSWSAAHQRQETFNSVTGFSGAFTKAFTDTCREYKEGTKSDRTFSYSNLFDDVSGKVTEDRSNAGRYLPAGPSPQFVQLWSHLADGDEDGFTKDDLLNSHVVV